MSKQHTSKTPNNSPIDNLTYDIVTMLHEKGKALEAYDKYLQDAQGHQQVRELIEQVQQTDIEHVQKLKECLGQLLGGKQSTQSAG
jgi:hypothetical protein